MLLNLSNHPANLWSQNQIAEAQKLYGGVIDLDFPAIPPEANENYIADLAERYKTDCIKLISQSNDQNNAVHIMGEQTFCFSLITKLIQSGITCVASTTDRNTTELGNVKTSNFEFTRFREYKFVSISKA